ncbi:MAG: T9SS type A sorting domain-containing protein [Bacteroidales bacterium]|nr:T9SS type A sorting domain-containing protein [Bacteroidales bacterium]
MNRKKIIPQILKLKSNIIIKFIIVFMVIANKVNSQNNNATIKILSNAPSSNFNKNIMNPYAGSKVNLSTSINLQTDFSFTNDNIQNMYIPDSNTFYLISRKENKLIKISNKEKKWVLYPNSEIIKHNADDFESYTSNMVVLDTNTVFLVEQYELPGFTDPLSYKYSYRLFKSQDGGQTWANISNSIATSNQIARKPYSLQIHFFNKNDGLLVITSTKGPDIYTTDDGGVLWKITKDPFIDKMDINSFLFIDKTSWIVKTYLWNNNEYIYYKTQNSGETWAIITLKGIVPKEIPYICTNISANEEKTIFFSLFTADNPKPYFVNNDENTGEIKRFNTCATFKSTDLGNNWEKLSEFKMDNIIYQPLDIKIIDKTGYMLFLNYDTLSNEFVNSVYKTTDEGKSWNFIFSPDDDILNEMTEIQYINKNECIVLSHHASEFALYKYSENFSKKNKISVFTDFTSGCYIGIDSLLFAGKNGVIAKITGDITEFRASIPGVDLFGIDFINHAEGLVVGGNGTIYKTIDGGDTWIEKYSSIALQLNDIFYFSPDSIFACGNNGIILLSINKGENWSVIPSGANESLNQIYINKNKCGYITGNNGLVLTSDNLNTWTLSPKITSVNLYGIDFYNDSIGCIVGEKGIILRTINNGESWNLANSGAEIDLFSISFNKNNQRGYASGKKGGILCSDDYGYTWKMYNEVFDEQNIIMATIPNGNGFYTAGTNNSINAYKVLQNVKYQWEPAEIFNFSTIPNPEVVINDTVIVHVKAIIDNKFELTDSLKFEPQPFRLNTAMTYFSVICGDSVSLSMEIDKFKATLYIDSTINLTDIYMKNKNTGYCVGEKGTIIKTENAWNDYEYLASNTLEKIQSISFYGNTGFCVGDNGTVLKTTDGINWQKISVPVNEGLKSLFILNDQIVFAGGKNGLILKSINSGAYWELISTNCYNSINKIYFINENIGFAVGNNFTFIQTNNGGLSWFIPEITYDYPETKNYINDKDLIEIGFYKNKGFVIGSNFYIESNDNGTTWHFAEHLITTYNGYWYSGYINSCKILENGNFFIQESKNNIHTNNYQGPAELDKINSFYSISKNLVFGVGNNGLIYKWGELDGLKYKWVPATGLENDTLLTTKAFPITSTQYKLTVNSPYFKEVISQPLNVNVNYSFANTEIIDTVTCGQKYELDATVGIPWSVAKTVDYHTCVPYFLNNKIGFIPDQALETTNGGISWQYNDKSIGGNMISMFFLNDSIWLAPCFIENDEGGYDYSVSKTFNAGKDWIWDINVMYEAHKVKLINQQKGFAICRNGYLLITNNQGNSWESYMKLSEYCLNDLLFFNESKGYILSEKGELFVTNNSGSTWEKKNLLITNSLNQIVYTNENDGYIVANNGILLTTRNGGDEWSINTLNSNIHLNAITFIDETNGYIAGSEGIIYKTNNKGYNWEKMHTGVTNSLKSIHFIDENTGFAGGNNILLKYRLTPAAQYTWETATGITDLHNPKPIIAINNSYNYHATIIQSPGCGESELTYKITSVDYDLAVTNKQIDVICGQAVILNPEINCYHCVDLKYEWEPAEGLSGTSIENPVANIVNSKTYFFKVTNPNACDGGIESASGKITVNLLAPEINFVRLSENQVRLSVKGKYKSYLWSTGEITPTIVAGHGTYTAIVTAANGCTIETDPFVFNNDNPDNVIYNKTNDIIVYPNPANDKLYISFPENTYSYHFIIYDLLGNLIFENNMMNSNEELDISRLKQGIYLITIRAEEKIYIRKIVKKAKSK